MQIFVHIIINLNGRINAYTIIYLSLFKDSIRSMRMFCFLILKLSVCSLPEVNYGVSRRFTSCKIDVFANIQCGIPSVGPLKPFGAVYMNVNNNNAWHLPNCGHLHCKYTAHWPLSVTQSY